MSGCRVLRALGRVDVVGQRLLRRGDEAREGRRLVDGELGQHATVDLHAGEAEALHEAVVGQAVLAARGVDALDPQAPEVALALAPVTVRVDERVGDLLLRLPVQTRTLPAVTGGALADHATLLAGVYRPLDSSHFVAFLTCVGALSDRGASWR